MFLQHERAYQWNRIIRFPVFASVFAIAILATGPGSSAQIIQSADYEPEIVNGNQGLALQDAFSQVRNGGHLMDVWRGHDNNNVWMAIDNGTPFTFGGAATFTTPAVAAYGSDSFMVMFVGFDDHIWYTFVGTNGSNSNSWSVIPIQTTALPVSAVQMGDNATNVFVVYHGEGSDNRVFQTWYSGQTESWADAGVIQNGMALAEPAVTFNPASGRLFVVAKGLNSDIWMTSQPLGAHEWQAWEDLGGGEQFSSAPTITATSDGTMMIAGQVPENGNLLGLYDLNGNPVQRWVKDTAIQAEAHIVGTVQLAPVGTQIFALYDYALGVQTSGAGYFKRVF